MNVLEVFYDYACPYCMRAHALLHQALEPHPDIEVVWRPCEAHPRPDSYGPHSDLLIRGYFYARDAGADVMEYHDRMYGAALVKRVNVEDAGTVVAQAQGLLDTDGLDKALRSGGYADELNRANGYAYDENGVWAVPAYRMNGAALDAVENVGVNKAQLERFLKKAKR